MTTSNKIGSVYTGIMTLYFTVSGLSVLSDIPAKLARIDLQALNSDGEISFILIYCGLMVGIAAAMLILWRHSQSWFHSAILATTIVASFILFRIVGSIMVGSLSDAQAGFLFTEITELAIGCTILWKCNPNRV